MIDGEKVKTFEAHSVAVLAAVVTMLLGFIGFTTWQTSIGVAELRVEMRVVAQNSERLHAIENRLREIEREF